MQYVLTSLRKVKLNRVIFTSSVLMRNSVCEFRDETNLVFDWTDKPTFGWLRFAHYFTENLAMNTLTNDKTFWNLHLHQWVSWTEFAIILVYAYIGKLVSLKNKQIIKTCGRITLCYYSITSGTRTPVNENKKATLNMT